MNIWRDSFLYVIGLKTAKTLFQIEKLLLPGESFMVHYFFQFQMEKSMQDACATFLTF